MLKNAYFFGKRCKKLPQRWGLPDPRVVTPTYYYNFAKFISRTKCGLLPSKKNKFCMFKILAAIFHFKLVFVGKGRKIFLAPGAGYPSYVTG